MQEKRHNADYDPYHKFSKDDVALQITSAEDAINKITESAFETSQDICRTHFTWSTKIIKEMICLCCPESRFHFHIFVLLILYQIIISSSPPLSLYSRLIFIEIKMYLHGRAAIRGSFKRLYSLRHGKSVSDQRCHIHQPFLHEVNPHGEFVMKTEGTINLQFPGCNHHHRHGDVTAKAQLHYLAARPQRSKTGDQGRGKRPNIHKAHQNCPCPCYKAQAFRKILLLY